MRTLTLFSLLLFINVLFAQESLKLLLELDKGMNEYDIFGYCVSNAGDFDKDGYDDIIVGKSLQQSRQCSYLLWRQANGFER